MTYEPVKGTGYTKEEATTAWRMAMIRSGPAWQLRGPAGQWYWDFWNFGKWIGHVEIHDDGFHWRTRSYDTGKVIHSGVTTSLFETYGSVTRNEKVEIEKGKE